MDEPSSETIGVASGEEQMSKGICRVCGNPEGNQTVVAREMMFGTGEEFEYFRCAGCECLQITELPGDLSLYYPPGYYSLDTRPTGAVKKFLKRLRARHSLGEESWLGGLLVGRYGEPPYAPWIRRSGVGFDSSILDVGCGGGNLLLDMRDAGFTDLTGVDPHIDHDLELGGGLRIWKTTLDRVESRFDLVMLNHSLEHSPDPLDLLGLVRLVLNSRGRALIRVPVANCYAWQTYGTDWVQLDAPRHLVIPTEKSMNLLCKEAGLEIGEVVYDSDAFQFWGSEQYRRGISLIDPRSHAVTPRASIFTPEQIGAFEARATELNQKRQGDQACFYLHSPDDRG